MQSYFHHGRRNNQIIWSSIRNKVFLFLVIAIAFFFLYSSDPNVKEEVRVDNLGYQILEENILASRIELAEIPSPFLEPASNPDPGIEFPEPVVDPIDPRVANYDRAGHIITQQLNSLVGLNLGFLYSQGLQVTGTDNISFTPEELANVVPPEAEKIQLSLAEQYPDIPLTETRNLLIYEKYQITTPIIYSTFEDLFFQMSPGRYDYSRPVDTSGTDSPIQQKLNDGIVHLAYSPLPGEIGNSYIVGHSSNFSYIDSDYKTIFAPIQEKSQPGETFVIYDPYGRELKFEVFETLRIAEEDITEAYKTFDDRRVVTLQTSILTTVNGSLQPTHRWLTRAELVVD